MTPRDLAEIFIDKAREDVRAMVRLAADPEQSDYVIGFHAQQAVEKALKAVLTAAGIRAGRTHNLARLREQFEDGQIEVPEWLTETDVLGSFAVTFRYPTLDEDEPLDRATTIPLVERAVEWAVDQLRDIG